jgi:regulator of sigma E protease
MPVDLLHSLSSNAWSVFLVVLFFGGSIFVHELGHFLAARSRGVFVEHFSIGFGPAIWSHRGRDGTEYRINWIPLGGYVMLPQLADLSGIEGQSRVDAAALPPADYGSKILIFLAGATFNILFALGLACVVWVTGEPEYDSLATTRIGYVKPSLEMPDGSTVVSPAAQAGLRVGDVVRAVDGRKVKDWSELTETLVTSSGRDSGNNPSVAFGIERDGKPLTVVLRPRLAGDEGLRQVGISPAFDLIVYGVDPKSPEGRAGFMADDQILRFDGAPVLNDLGCYDYLQAHADRTVRAVVLRGGREAVLIIGPHPAVKGAASFGLTLGPKAALVHTPPLTQLGSQFSTTFRTLGSLLNPRSDIGLSKISGPVGIVRMLHSAASVGVGAVLVFTIFVNVNLAIFNLLPLPILDGGQILFATVGRLRGRALPAKFIVTAQSVFAVLLISLIVYVSFFDVRRWAHDAQAERVLNEK